MLDLRTCAPQHALDVAHVISLARPGPEWPTGLIVATTQPNLYHPFDLPIYPLAD